MPVSDKQLAANRANAARSTGPRSREGKIRSAQNSRKHNFTGASFAIVRLEDLEEIARLKEDLVAVYQPVNSQELFTLERMALAQQTILRIARLEAGLLTSCLDECLTRQDTLFYPMSEQLAGNGDIEITCAQNRNFALATGFRHMAAESNSWSLFLRYQAQAERLYRRAVEEFERLRALRHGELPNEPISGAEPEQNQPVPVVETNPSPAPPGAPRGPLPSTAPKPPRTAAPPPFPCPMESIAGSPLTASVSDILSRFSPNTL